MVSRKTERLMKRTGLLAPIARMSQRKRILANIDRRLDEIGREEKRRIDIAAKVAERNARGGLETAKLTMELAKRVTDRASAKRGLLNRKRNRVLGKSGEVG